MAIVALLTDFGAIDPYVGVMKGALLSVAPGATIVDLLHEVPPQDVAAGAFVLGASRGYFPLDAIFVAVVDPGVGSARRAIAVETAEGQRFVGPDNGLFPAALAGTRVVRAVELTERRFHRPLLSRTFHGRDLFAPVAGHLASGVPLEALGRAIPPRALARLPGRRAAPAWRGGRARGRVVWIDRYGNCVTDLPAALVEGRRVRLRAGAFSTERLAKSYASVERGAPLAIVGSYGLVEIAVRDGSAAATLGLARGAAVVVEARR
jgi:S-adenosylmethionine hydrolase